ncbi:MAG TPA: vanadium-dependent haloperoxidase [Cyclobacteriaceae bacterium]|nr:vanadium-dependent haloperoxidase [Cyclobacteriaceae bacterium]
MKRSVLLFVILVFFYGCVREKSGNYKLKAGNPEFLHRAMKEITDRMVHDIFAPPVASRIYAYTSIAAYEAAVHQDAQFISLAGQLHGLDSVPQPNPKLEYCFPLASVQALMKVGKSMIFSEPELDSVHQQMIEEFRSFGIPNDVFERSIGYGDKVAGEILAWASKDNYKQSRSLPKYVVENDPAKWRPTPPAYMDAVEPHWNKIRTFVIDSASQFTPEPPTPYSAVKSSKFYREADEVYQIRLKLTEEEREIAGFWDCNPFMMNVSGHVMFATKKISPGGHWINITRVVCTMDSADFIHSAEAYARIAISLNEAFVSCWDEKYRSKLVRPETYINQYIDKDWTPLLQTPPFPEYTSGHSVISNSAAVALTDLFGDNFAFIDSTEVEFALPPRKFTSFFAAAEEAAISRLYGGIHYRPAAENGMKQGRQIGEFVLQHMMTRKK